MSGLWGIDRLKGRVYRSAAPRTPYHLHSFVKPISATLSDLLQYYVLVSFSFAMEIQSPVDESSSPFNRLPPIPTCTPIQVIENLRSLYAEKNIQGFRDVLDSHSDSSYLRHFEIRDLDTVMIDAIRQDNTRFTTELLCRGLPLVPDYVLEAAKFKAKRVLELFFEKGWNINSPISQAQPPVLR